ncbi:MAG TPA: hypothetical protein PKA17_08715, partial [Phenylobacterium sp.]|nr:hypothetical protein [Phenylobacterium sp.]
MAVLAAALVLCACERPSEAPEIADGGHEEHEPGDRERHARGGEEEGRIEAGRHQYSIRRTRTIS